MIRKMIVSEWLHRFSDPFLWLPNPTTNGSAKKPYVVIRKRSIFANIALMGFNDVVILLLETLPLSLYDIYK
jgi:hypothetical protein